MPHLEFVLGSVAYPALELPEGCRTVRTLHERLNQGLLGEQFRDGDRLRFLTDLAGKPLYSAAELPGKLHVQGPPTAVRSFAFSLNKVFKKDEEKDGGLIRSGALTERSHSRQHKGSISYDKEAVKTSLECEIFVGLGAADMEAVAAVLHFWFEELDPEQLFNHSRMLDERVRSEFGALQHRAAAGELNAWTQQPDSCLALVVILDQLTRIIFRGTPASYSCDTAARAAANVALTRGDDRNHWSPGWRRSALYLPFMRSEDVAEKHRALNLMHESLKTAFINSKKATQAMSGPTVAVPALPRLTLSVATPRLTAAPDKIPMLMAKRPSKDELSDAGSKSDVSESSGTNDEAIAIPLRSISPKPLSPSPASARPRVEASARSRGKKKAAAHRTYSMQAVLDMMPRLEVAQLNHEHAKRFRCMRLDSQTQQIYMRDRADSSNRICRYHCIVCNVNHDLRLTKGGAGNGER